MRIEEFSPKILHVNEDNNDIADAMSRIPQKKEMLASEEIFSCIEEHHANARKKLGIKDKKNDFFQKCPVDMEFIQSKQLEDIKALKSGKECFQDNRYGLNLWFIKVDSLNE